MREDEEPLKVGEYAIIIEGYHGQLRYWPHHYAIGTRVKITDRNLSGYPSYYTVTPEQEKDNTHSMVGCPQLRREEFLDIVKQILSDEQPE